MLSNTAQGFPVPQKSKSPPKKSSWPTDKVERRKVKDLVPYAKNARTHSEEQIEQIARAIEQWGWTVPCLVTRRAGSLPAMAASWRQSSSGLMKCRGGRPRLERGAEARLCHRRQQADR